MSNFWADITKEYTYALRVEKLAQKQNSIKYDSDATVRRALLEFGVYMIFLMAATIVANSVQHFYMFYFNQTVEKLFLKRETETKYGKEVEFWNLVTTSDWWSFLEKNFLDGLHGDENDVNSTKRLLLKDNMLLGPPRLRQMRVKSHSCEINDAFRRYFNSCYAGYSSGIEYKKANYKGTQYYSKRQLDAITLKGQIAYYYGGGYVQMLTYEREANQKIFDNLKDIKWIDRGTRIVILEFVLLNSNAYMLDNVKILAELPPVGGIVPSHQLQPLKFSLWMEKDAFLYIAAIIYYLMAGFYTFEEITEIRAIGPSAYCKSLWNVFDVLVLLLAYFSFFYNLVQPMLLNRSIDAAQKDDTRFHSIDNLCYWNTIYIDAMGISVFLIWIKIFKFIGFNKTMLQFSTTLGRCSKDLFGFAVMFFIVFLAYAQLGLLLFGASHPDFRDFGTSVITLMRMFLGDFEYQLIEEANYFLGPIYFITYVLLVFFILLNMFLAIVNDTYAAVKLEITEGHTNLGDYVIHLWGNFRSTLKKCFQRRRKEVVDADGEGKTAIDLEKSSVDFSSSEATAYTHTSITPRTQARLELTGILREYFEELSPELIDQNGRYEDTSSVAANADEIRRLKHRVGLLEDVLEQLVAGMDRILEKVDSRKHAKKE
ncbi:polycystin-2 [Glossina fuscipes]|uniref:Polycystin-2 n=1 Tax=Glossina fuscipes TaxID=7396 RepID=A0A8U0WIM3_9MUSC|nr:polycystin-2 [Glossina fuscipes]